MALTSSPAAGAKLRGETLSDITTERTPLFARVSADQALTTSSTVLENVTDLALAVEANCTYTFELVVLASVASGAAEDIKIGYTFPTGATVDQFPIGPGSSTVSTSLATVVQFGGNTSMTSGGTTREYGLTTGFGVIRIALYVAIGATAGTLQVQAAQNTSGANAVTVKAGSMLEGHRVA